MSSMMRHFLHVYHYIFFSQLWFSHLVNRGKGDAKGDDGTQAITHPHTQLSVSPPTPQLFLLSTVQNLHARGGRGQKVEEKRDGSRPRTCMHLIASCTHREQTPPAWPVATHIQRTSRGRWIRMKVLRRRSIRHGAGADMKL